MIQSILLATDGSANAGRAAAAAGELAGALKAKLTVIHVGPEYLPLGKVTDPKKGPPFPAEVQADIDAVIKAAAGWQDTPFSRVPAPPSAIAYLTAMVADAAAAVARDNGAADVTVVTPIGDATDEILAEAKRTKADMIVIGSRGMNKMEELVLGGVSQKVLHLAPCPCLVVK